MHHHQSHAQQLLTQNIKTNNFQTLCSKLHELNKSQLTHETNSMINNFIMNNQSNNMQDIVRGQLQRIINQGKFVIREHYSKEMRAALTKITASQQNLNSFNEMPKIEIKSQATFNLDAQEEQQYQNNNVNDNAQHYELKVIQNISQNSSSIPDIFFIPQCDHDQQPLF